MAGVRRAAAAATDTAAASAFAAFAAFAFAFAAAAAAPLAQQRRRHALFAPDEVLYEPPGRRAALSAAQHGPHGPQQLLVAAPQAQRRAGPDGNQPTAADDLRQIQRGGLRHRGPTRGRAGPCEGRKAALLGRCDQPGVSGRAGPWAAAQLPSNQVQLARCVRVSRARARGVLTAFRVDASRPSKSAAVPACATGRRRPALRGVLLASVTPAPISSD
jgi:hypothetical protein